MGLLRDALLPVLAIGLLAALGAEVAHRAGLLGSAEAVVQDGLLRSLGPRQDRGAPVVIAAVDDATLARMPDPIAFWGPAFARGVETIRGAGARAVALDFLFEVSGEDFFRRHDLDQHQESRAWDASFRAMVHRGDAVLVARLGRAADGSVTVDLPLGDYVVLVQRPRAQLGLADLPMDGDNVVRRFWPVVAPTSTGPAHSLALALALAHQGLDAEGTSFELGGREVGDRPVGLAWAGPAGSVPRVPFWKLLEPDQLEPGERALIDGAAVLVGATFDGATDLLDTPWGPMPGVEVQANAVATLLSGERIQEVADPARLGLLALLGLGAAAAFLRLRPVPAAALLAGGLGGLAVGGWALVAGASVLLPVPTLALATSLAFVGALALRWQTEDRLRRQLRRLFERYVSDAVVRDLLADPRALALGGERREVTVLFSDIRGFTTLSEALQPEEVVELLNRWLELACRPILEQGGIVDKFIGDAVMAVFGAPVRHEDHAARAVQAARGMALAVAELRQWAAVRFADRDLGPFDVGVGLHTGPALVGNIGFARRTQYTAIGDTVNVASRIEGLTKDLGCPILASATTVAAAGPEVRTGRRAVLPVKGRAVPVEVVEILKEDRP